jgi:hypothetical protein
MSRAWGREEFPVLANWIEANAVPLERVREAVARRQFYSPLQYVPGEPALLKAVLQTYMQEFRVTSRLLVARALLALGKEEVEAGWADLHAAHRLARLIAHGPTHIDALLCVAIEEQVFRAAVVMLDRFRLTDQQARRCLQDLQLLPPAARMADVIDNSERYAFLQIVSIIATDKEGPDSLYTFLNDPPADDPIRTIYPAAAELVDWSEVLRLGNAWFDRIVAAMRRPTRVERVDALWRNLTTELNAPTSHGRLTRRFVNELKEQHPQKLAHSFSQLMAVLFLLPFQALQDAEDSAGTRCDLLRIAFGLAAYRADKGVYPDGLHALAPDYLPAVPRDVFSNQTFAYRTEGVGYVLYSVGVDAEDDGGRSRDDEPAGDDNAIRVTHRTE